MFTESNPPEMANSHLAPGLGRYNPGPYQLTVNIAHHADFHKAFTGQKEMSYPLYTVRTISTKKGKLT